MKFLPQLITNCRPIFKSVVHFQAHRCDANMEETRKEIMPLTGFEPMTSTSLCHRNLLLHYVPQSSYAYERGALFGTYHRRFHGSNGSTIPRQLRLREASSEPQGQLRLFWIKLYKSKARLVG